MSTYYYAVCDEHKAVSRILGGRSFPSRWWQNDDGELAEFLEAHGDCAPEIVSEHDDRTIEYTEVSGTGEQK